MHPSILFLDEYVACRTMFPVKPPKGNEDYCLATFDGLIKRIVTMGASVGGPGCIFSCLRPRRCVVFQHRWSTR